MSSNPRRGIFKESIWAPVKWGSVRGSGPGAPGLGRRGCSLVLPALLVVFVLVGFLPFIERSLRFRAECVGLKVQGRRRAHEALPQYERHASYYGVEECV